VANQLQLNISYRITPTDISWLAECNVTVRWRKFYWTITIPFSEWDIFSSIHNNRFQELNNQFYDAVRQLEMPSNRSTECLFYHIAKQGNFATQKACICHDIPWQLPCSGT